MGTSIYTDEQLDAMTAEEAWERTCYAAWFTRRDIRRQALMSNALARHQDAVQLLLTQHKCDDPKCGVCQWNRFAKGG